MTNEQKDNFKIAQKWLFSEGRRLKKTVSDWRVFWLILVSLSFCWLLFTPVEKAVVLASHIQEINSYVFVMCGLVIGIFTTLLIFLIKPGIQLNVQNLHKQPSWVFYSYWGLINTFAIWSIVDFITKIQTLWEVGICLSLGIILIKWINEWMGKKPDLEFKCFSAGSVGIEDDDLDFKTPAKNVAEGLKNLKGYVNVVGLYGGFGFGKSSYARMVIENFNQEKTLYTYISLTETNEAQDFSKLFAERWLETLSERYPKIDVTSYLPFMDSILRESGNGIFSGVLKVISEFNRGLTKTRAFFFDDFYSKKDKREKIKSSSSRVAKLFGNISDIKETFWIIMVDEIERAQFDEIYRLVEIVERFKHEGRSGMPTKLLFLFCISEPYFEEYLNSHDDDPRVHSLKTFFYEDPKSVAHKIFLPPIESAVKQKYILNQFNKVIDREGIKTPKEVNPHAMGDPSRSFMSDHKDALEYILAVFRTNSLRTINRIATTLDFFYGAFRDRMGELRKNTIRFSDILTLEYIKIRYPYLFIFFTQTVHILVNQAETHNMDAYFAKENLKDKKLDLIGWIEEVTGRKIPESEKQDVLKIVGLVMYYYFDFLGNNYDSKSKVQYQGTTSYPEVMCDYLSLLAEGTETSYRKYSDLYQKHKTTSEGFVQSLSNSDLLGYTRFIFGVQNAPVQINMDLIGELANRIVTRAIPSDPMNIDNTALDEAVYQFTFQIVAVSEKEKRSENPSSNFEKIFNDLKKVLTSDEVSTGLKYIILSSLVNNERGGGSSIHLRLENAFEKISRYYDSETRTIIKSVYKEFEDRYLKGDKVLYDHEENFFWTMYQSWSGSSDAKEEIERIRAVAKRGLKNNLQALKLYWRKYPDPTNTEWKEFQDVFEDHRFFSFEDTTNPIYMPLKELITITKESNVIDDEIREKVRFWDSVKDDAKLKELSVIKDTDSTLRSYLIRKGFLDPESKKLVMIESSPQDTEQ